MNTKKMWQVKVFVGVIALIVFMAQESLSYASNPEEEFQQANILLKQGKLQEALTIFTKLENEATSLNFQQKVKLGIIDATIEEARILKANKDNNYESKIYNAYGNLQNLFRTNKSSPEIYFLFAKYYHVNNKIMKAEKSLKKAFYFKSDYTDAYIFQGEMYLEEAKMIGSSVLERVASRSEAKEAFEDYRIKAKRSFEQILSSSSDLNNETKARIYFRLGEVYYHLYDEKNKAKEQWSNAISISPESSWGTEAQERLNTSK